MRLISFSIALGLLAACGSEKIPTTRYYKLDVPPPPTPPAPAAPVSLRIEPFRTTSLLRQDRIVYRASPVEVGFYEYHRWAEAPNDTLTKALADQLMKRSAFQSVKISDDERSADYVLKGSVDRLQEVDYMGGVRAQVTISLALEESVQHQTIWSGSASSESAVAKRDVQGVVTAMGQASQQSLGRLITDMTKVVQAKRLGPVSSAARSTP